MINENEINGGSVVERFGALADGAKRLQFFLSCWLFSVKKY